MLHPKFDQARIASQILSCYNGTDKLTTPIINQVDFEKSIQEDKINFVLDNVMKSWSSSMISKLEEEKDEVKKSELNTEITKEISVLHKIDVVFDRMVKSVWVDIIDVTTKTFKDNSLTKKLNLSGKPV